MQLRYVKRVLNTTNGADGTSDWAARLFNGDDSADRRLS
jgi:hypothetical protein